ncbi:MAG: hypothetical protein ACR2QU_00770 [Gammaproteobacteria bacterium]
MPISRRLINLSVVAGFVLVAPQTNSHAADLPGSVQYEATTDSGLSFSIVPFYFWVPGLNGTAGVLGTTAEIDITPIDVIENLGDYLDSLDGLYKGTGEVRYREFGLLYDVFHTEVSSADEIDLGIISPIALDVGFSMTMATLAGSYRFHESANGYIAGLAGVRIWDVNVDIGVDLNIVALTASDGDTWVDPIIGGKGRFNLTENAYASGWAMIGGFGAGSDFMWDIWGNVGYQKNNWLDLFAGLRATGTEYQNGSFVWDIVQYGPVIGATINLN